MKFSVIIPFADDETTLRDCLDSVRAALDRLPTGEAEVICVNDGSRDGSEVLLEGLAAEDRRITVLRDPSAEGRRGPGHARNQGIDRARGEYLVFVDADDVILPEAFAALQGISADIVTFLPPTRAFDFAKRTDRRRAFSPMVGNLLAWNAVYRREMLGAWRFPELFNYEDLVFTAGAFARARTLVAGIAPWYRHHERSGGLSHTFGWRRVGDGLRVCLLLPAACSSAHEGLVTRLVLLRKTLMHLILHVLAVPFRICR